MAKLDDEKIVPESTPGKVRPAAIIICREGQIQHVSRDTLILFGYTLDEFQTMPVHKLIRGGAALPANGKSVHRPGRRKDGSEFAAIFQSFELVMSDAPASVMVLVTDISSQKSGQNGRGKYPEQATAGSEALAALDLLEDNVVVFDRKWRYLFANAAAMALTGMDKAQVLGHPYWEVFPYLTGTPVDEALRRGFDSPGKVSLEHHSDHTGQWYCIEIIPSGSTLTVHSWDITASKRTVELNRRLMKSLDSITDPIMMMDRNMVYTFVNSAATNFAGHDRSELLGRKVWELSPWLKDTPFGRACLRALDETSPFTIEDHYLPRDRWLNVRYFPVPDGLTVHIADVTDLKQSRQHIDELLSGPGSEDQLQAVFDLMPTPMLIVDAEMRYTYANAVAMRTNKRSPKMIGAQMWELNPPITRTALVRSTRQAFKTGRRQKFELKLPPVGRWLAVEAIPWRDKVILAAVDITKQKQSEESVGILTSTLEQVMNDGWNRPSARETKRSHPTPPPTSDPKTSDGNAHS